MFLVWANILYYLYFSFKLLQHLIIYGFQKGMVFFKHFMLIFFSFFFCFELIKFSGEEL